MIYYRVTADIFFDIEDEATDFYHDCQLALAKGVTINSGNPNEERSQIVLHDCQHAQQQHLTCTIRDSAHSP